MVYKIKEIFVSFQGEGAQTGMVATFLRFSGCNLWNGSKEKRHDSTCSFCDTDFLGTDGSAGGIYDDPLTLAERIEQIGNSESSENGRLVVITGGEPLLQLDDDLIAELKSRKMRLAVETNGTLVAPDGIDWLCVSPKSGVDLVQRSGEELKLVYPQAGIDPRNYETFSFRHFFLQPRYDERYPENLERTLAYCKMNPFWRLSLQLHKYIDIP